MTKEREKSEITSRENLGKVLRFTESLMDGKAGGPATRDFFLSHLNHRIVLVLLTLEKPLTQSGLTDFYINYYKLV